MHSITSEADLRLARLHMAVEEHVGVLLQLCVGEGACVAPPSGLQVCRECCQPHAAVQLPGRVAEADLRKRQGVMAKLQHH